MATFKSEIFIISKTDIFIKIVQRFEPAALHFYCIPKNTNANAIFAVCNCTFRPLDNSLTPPSIFHSFETARFPINRDGGCSFGEFSCIALQRSCSYMQVVGTATSKLTC